MKVSSSLLLICGLAASANASQKWDNGTVYTTEIVTAYTTYCPGPTTVVQNNKTYTVSSATTLTITNCPCTITSIVSPGPNVPAGTGAGVSSTSATVVPTTTAGGGSSSTSSTLAPLPTSNAAQAYAAPFGALIAGCMAVLLL